MSDMSSFDSALGETFRKLGLPDPMVMGQIAAEWSQLAGPPWADRSKPLTIRSRTLVVEAAAPSMVAFLRYGTTELLTALEARFGKGVIDEVEVVAPARG